MFKRLIIYKIQIMSCNCGAKINNVPCCCQTGEVTPCPTTMCPDNQPCDIIAETDCIIYTGPPYPEYGIQTGITITEITEIIIDILNLRCTTTTTSTTSTSTTSTSKDKFAFGGICPPAPREP